MAKPNNGFHLHQENNMSTSVDLKVESSTLKMASGMKESEIKADKESIRQSSHIVFRD